MTCRDTVASGRPLSLNHAVTSEATAVFSCMAPSGSGKDELRVSAKKTVAGEWEVTHEIQRGKPR